MSLSSYTFCADCNTAFGPTNTFLYCKTCRQTHSNDLIEIIHGDSPSQVYVYQHVIQACAAMRALGPIRYRLSLQHVMDKLPRHMSFEKLHIPMDAQETLVLSCVHKLSNMRKQARADIRQRIAAGQCKAGVLVFSCAHRDARSYDKQYPRPANGISWVNRSVLGPAKGKTFFLDQCVAHITHTSTMHVPNLVCVTVPKNLSEGTLKKEMRQCTIEACQT